MTDARMLLVLYGSRRETRRCVEGRSPASGDGTDARARVSGAESRRSFAASRVCDDATRRDAIPDATPPRA